MEIIFRFVRDALDLGELGILFVLIKEVICIFF